MSFFELHINCFLKQSTPLEIIQTLQYMVSKEKINIPDYINYAKTELFKNDNWDRFLINDLPHFPFKCNSNIIISKTFGNLLSINTSFISKDNMIIYNFLEWIKPYIDDNNDFIGWFREFKKLIELIYFEDNKIMIRMLS